MYVLGVAKLDLGSVTRSQKNLDFLKLFVGVRLAVSFAGVQIS
jgi:hypothetical protein